MVLRRTCLVIRSLPSPPSSALQNRQESRLVYRVSLCPDDLDRVIGESRSLKRFVRIHRERLFPRRRGTGYRACISCVTYRAFAFLGILLFNSQAENDIAVSPRPPDPRIASYNSTLATCSAEKNSPCRGYSPHEGDQQPPIQRECGVESSTRGAADAVSAYFFFNVLGEPMEAVLGRFKKRRMDCSF
jgi:hypothetical protein